MDIIIGLYKPRRGKIYIDNITLNKENVGSWRRKIGYIPQSIYLFDGTVAENVVFGNKIEEEKIIRVLQKANIWEFLIKYHQGLYTRVGENGIKLSGGQRQRIAIARALYKNPEVLALDEATSSLDSETEAKIMDEIYNLANDITLIIIAHRISTLDRCDRVYKIENGSV